MFFKKKKIEVYAPIDGAVIKIEDVKDPVYSDKILGDGFAIIPKKIKKVTFFAPVSGVLVTTVDTGHIYGIIEKDSKVECLIHIGIDTVELNGQGFESKVKKAEKISAQDSLVIINLDVIKKHKKDSTTPIVFTKESIAERGYKINVLKYGKVKQGDVVAELIRE